MNQYLLLLHENPADSATLTSAEMHEIIASHQAWAEALAERGQLAGGEKLTDDGGRRLLLQDGRPLASDGPYAEAKEVESAVRAWAAAWAAQDMKAYCA